METGRPKSFFKESDFKSFAKCVALTWGISTGLYFLCPVLIGNKWVPFLVALGVSLFRSFHNGNFSIKEFVLCVLNGFLLFVTALGLSGALSTLAAPTSNNATIPQTGKLLNLHGSITNSVHRFCFTGTQTKQS